MSMARTDTSIRIIVLVRMSSLVYPVAPVHLPWGMLNVWQSASVAKMSKITSCIVKSQRVDIALDSESKLLLTRAGRGCPFRHCKSKTAIWTFKKLKGSHLKITVCPRHRYLFGTRWRCGNSRCSIPAEVAMVAAH